MGTEIEKVTTDVEKILETCNVTALANMSALTQAVTLASGISQLRKALTDDVMERVFMPLQSTRLGFLTDKDHPPKEMSPEERKNWKPGYSIRVVRDCIIEALIHGLRPVGNEFNIISKSMYAATNGLARRVSEYPGLTDLVITPTAPMLSQDKQSARVGIHAVWRLNGNPMSMVLDQEKREDGTSRDSRIEVRVNYGMGADAIIGKAKRKARAAILERITGSTLTFPVGDAIDTTGEEVGEPAPPPVPPEQDGKRMKLGSKPATPPAEPMREPGQEG